MRSLVRSLVLISLLLAASCVRGGQSGLNPGDSAPDFTAQLLTGGEKKLSDYRGKVVLLNFWASWCGPCVAEMPALQRLHDRFKDQGFTVLAVGVDDEDSALDEFRRRYGLSFPVLSEKNGASRKFYKTTGVPESFFIDADGKLVLFQDPEDNHPVVRISGPREWDSPNVINRVSKMLAERRNVSSNG